MEKAKRWCADLRQYIRTGKCDLCTVITDSERFMTVVVLLLVMLTVCTIVDGAGWNAQDLSDSFSQT